MMTLFLCYGLHRVGSRGEMYPGKHIIALDLEHGDTRGFIAAIPGDINHFSEVFAALIPSEGAIVVYADGEGKVPIIDPEQDLMPQLVDMKWSQVQRFTEWERFNSREDRRREAKLYTEHYLEDRRERGDAAMEEAPWSGWPFVGDRGRVRQVLVRLTGYAPAPGSSEEYVEAGSCEVDLATESAQEFLRRIPADLDERSRLAVVITPAESAPLVYLDGLAADPEGRSGIVREGRLRRIGDIGEEYGDLLRQEAIGIAQDRLRRGESS